MEQKIYKTTLIASAATVTILLTGCNTTTSPKVVKAEPTAFKPLPAIKKQEPILKRKVAIARFGNEAQYGKSAMFGTIRGYNAEKQTTDILSAKLTESGKFIMLERSDLNLVNKELDLQNLKSMNVGADYLITGSVSEFGRKNKSETGVFSRTKTQVAYAKVNVRLIDVKTGQIIFAQEGSGEAFSEAGTNFGVGTHVGYDSTLNDKAISSAISSVVDGIMQNLMARPWRSFVLSTEGRTVMMAGGAMQGVKIGETFSVFKQGKKVKNPQTGMMIELPGTKIASIKIASQFGSSYTDEGSIGQIVEGSLNGANINEIYIQK